MGEGASLALHNLSGEALVVAAPVELTAGADRLFGDGELSRDGRVRLGPYGRLWARVVGRDR